MKRMINPPKGVKFGFDQVKDCKKCHKAQRNTLVLFLIIGSASGVGFITGLIFIMLGLAVGIQEWQLAQFLGLPMLLGTISHLLWVTFNFDKLVCGCL
jgi:hypothetical protein